MGSVMLEVEIEEDLKNSVGKTLNKLGLDHSTAINIFYHVIEEYNGLPFPIKLPNKEMIQTMDGFARGGGVNFELPENFFQNMHI